MNDGKRISFTENPSSPDLAFMQIKGLIHVTLEEALEIFKDDAIKERRLLLGEGVLTTEMLKLLRDVKEFEPEYWAGNAEDESRPTPFEKLQDLRQRARGARQAAASI